MMCLISKLKLKRDHFGRLPSKETLGQVGTFAHMRSDLLAWYLCLWIEQGVSWISNFLSIVEVCESRLALAQGHVCFRPAPLRTRPYRVAIRLLKAQLGLSHWESLRKRQIPLQHPKSLVSFSARSSLVLVSYSQHLEIKKYLLLQTWHIGFSLALHAELLKFFQ